MTGNLSASILARLLTLAKQRGDDYNLLLNRSVDFTEYFELLRAGYPDSKDLQIHLALIQMLWDHVEPSGYTYRFENDPFPGTPERDVLIRAEATGTDTFEVNRNLLLTDGARADSVPNLEIETGEIVGAGHASATGRFDDEQLFYLRARGIPEDQARRLVVRGFFNEIITKIAVPAVRDRLTAAIEHELELTESRMS